MKIRDLARDRRVPGTLPAQLSNGILVIWPRSPIAAFMPMSTRCCVVRGDFESDLRRVIKR